MLRNKCRIKKDDKVKIITGKDKGKIGKVLRVDDDSMVQRHAHVQQMPEPYQDSDEAVGRRQKSARLPEVRRSY